MPTDGKATDREVLDAAAERLASLDSLVHGKNAGESPEVELARAVYDIGAKYGYEGAYLGELNYALTRFIQRVPQLKVQDGTWAQELHYWLYAATVEALIYAS